MASGTLRVFLAGYGVAGLLGLAVSLAAFGSAHAWEPRTAESALTHLRSAPPCPVALGSREKALNWISPCRYDLLYLSKAPGDVVSELEGLTSPDHEVHVRFRGLVGLTMRGEESGIRIARTWIEHEDETMRLAGWHSLLRCPNQAAVRNIIAPQAMLAVYRREQDPAVREQIERHFATHRTRFAVGALCGAVEDPATLTSGAVCALGAIGDPRGLDVLIRCDSDRVVVIDAIGQIGGSKAIDYLLDHLEDPAAALWLGRIGDRRALPNLRARLRLLEGSRAPGDRENPDEPSAAEDDAQQAAIRVVRLSILLLESDDLENALLDLAEDHAQPLWFRRQALHELERIGASRVLARLLRLYRKQMRSTLCVACVEALENEPDEEVTEAMKMHLLELESLLQRTGHRADESALQGAGLTLAVDDVFHALHKRIGNEVFSVSKQP